MPEFKQEEYVRTDAGIYLVLYQLFTRKILKTYMTNPKLFYGQPFWMRIQVVTVFTDAAPRLGPFSSEFQLQLPKAKNLLQ